MRFSVLAMLFASVYGAAPSLPPAEAKDVLADVPMAFVMAYDASCTHCAAAKPGFEDVESPVPTYLVDASTPESDAFRLAYNVSDFPSFLLLKYGKLTDTYEGEHARAAFESYLSGKAGDLAAKEEL